VQRILFIFLICVLGFNVTAQNAPTKEPVKDSVIKELHSPNKATLMSACLPGLGQIYNKKYWKVPVIYAGIGILTYFIVFNTNYYLTYKSAYIESVNKDSTGNYSEIVKKYTTDNIASAREYYRRNLEISILISALWYALNILDAAVDAHLFYYNINKDLSLRVEPTLIPPYAQSRKYTSGIRLCFNF
jgi:hypothetical protein